MKRREQRISAVERLEDYLESFPSWTKPPLLGAVLLFVIVGKGMLFGVPILAFFVYRDGFVVVLQLLAVLLGVSAAGGLGGLMYSIGAPVFRRAGRIGAYPLGVLCVMAYLTPIILLWPDDKRAMDLSDPVDRWIWLGVSVVCGVIVGTWFADDFAEKRTRRKRTAVPRHR